MEGTKSEFYSLDRSGERIVMQRRVGQERFIHFNCPPDQTHLYQALTEREIPFAIVPREHAIVLKEIKAVDSNTLRWESGLLLRFLGRHGWQIGLLV